jgi:nicotinamide riboside transporter PnuC
MPSNLPLLLALMLLGLSAPIAIWTVGGLENMLLCALLAWVLTWLLSNLSNDEPNSRSVLKAAIALGFLTLTRADGPLFVVAIVVGVLIFSRWPRIRRFGSAAWLGGIPFLFFVAQLLFRLSYYNSWLPNTYHAKFAVNSHRVDLGADYLLGFLSIYAPTLAVLVLLVLVTGVARLFGSDRVTLRSTHGWRRIGVLGCVCTTWVAYIVAVGGDTFPGFRQLTPVVVILSFLILELAENFRFSPSLARSAFVICILTLVGQLYLQSTHVESLRAKNRKWEWQCMVLAEELTKMWGEEQPLIAVTAAGCLPFFTGFPAIDMHGLNDAYMTRHKPESFGSGRVGHEIMNLNYILSRRPEIIVLHLGKHAYGSEFGKQKAIKQSYRPYKVKTHGRLPFNPTIWLRREFAARVLEPGPR